MKQLVSFVCIAAAFTGCITVQPAPAPASASSEAAVPAVNRTLDSWHQAASRSDEDTYFRLLSPDAIFLGTDASERWTHSEFRAFAHPYFSKGKGWTFTPRSRHVFLSEDGGTAWFDEVLDSASYGECRGTGVLSRRAGEWRITQYNLTIPIPNALAKDVVRMIREQPAPPASPPKP